jgi:hypothetical protein
MRIRPARRGRYGRMLAMDLKMVENRGRFENSPVTAGLEACSFGGESPAASPINQESLG